MRNVSVGDDMVILNVRAIPWAAVWQEEKMESRDPPKRL